MATATREQIAEIYIATFNRAADADGLSYWDGTGMPGTGAKSSLTDIEDIAEALLGSAEVKDMYGDPFSDGFDRESFVIKLYDNILNKKVDGTDEGVKYWVSSDVSNAKMILALLEGAKADTGDPMDKATLSNKLEVGLAFADAGLNDVSKAKSVMSGVTSDYGSVSSAKAVIKTLSPTDMTIEISGDGETTAHVLAETFDISTDSTYSHTIIDFDTTKDKLHFGDDITSKDISISNTADDGKVDLIYAVDGGAKVVTITLTGLTSSEDMGLTESHGLDAILS
jgi:hypothetical protein